MATEDMIPVLKAFAADSAWLRGVEVTSFTRQEMAKIAWPHFYKLCAMTSTAAAERLLRMTFSGHFDAGF
ncbi:hypothetical protein Lumi_078 [Xylophilus phage Lumi]|nr:hypothetical protein Lumi_078 [Xylophilus phage Lumi]